MNNSTSSSSFRPRRPELIVSSLPTPANSPCLPNSAPHSYTNASPASDASARTSPKRQHEQPTLVSVRNYPLSDGGWPRPHRNPVRRRNRVVVTEPDGGVVPTG